MSIYTTGDVARLCGVSVRTVQFYDTKHLLKPSALTEGGRRLYSEDDLKKMRLICLLKSLGLSLNSIRGILSSDNQNKVLLLLLDEQERQLDAEIGERQKQKRAIGVVRDSIRTMDSIPVNSINDIDKIVDGKRKLKKTYALMLIVGIIIDIIEICALLYWILKGVWWPFVAVMAGAVVVAFPLVRMYYRNAAYICPECSEKFKPTFGRFVFSKHTLKTRKLKCTCCGYEGYCVETFAD